MRPKSFALAGMLLAGLLGSASGQTGPLTSLERELVQRSLDPGDDSGKARVELRPGRLPERFGLTLPAGHRLIGSVVVTGPNSSSSVYFDTRLDAGQLAAKLTAELRRAGWQPFPEGPGFNDGVDGGFLPSAPLSGRPWYRRSPDQMLFIQTRPAGAVTQVTLRQNGAPFLSQQLESGGRGAVGRLPKLTPPSGSSVTPGGWGTSGASVTQDVQIETALTREALYEHYAAQLRRAGWVLVNRGQAGKIVSATWSVVRDNKTQLGLLIFTERAKGRYGGTLSLISAP